MSPGSPPSSPTSPIGRPAESLTAPAVQSRKHARRSAASGRRASSTEPPPRRGPHGHDVVEGEEHRGDDGQGTGREGADARRRDRRGHPSAPERRPDPSPHPVGVMRAGQAQADVVDVEDAGAPGRQVASHGLGALVVRVEVDAGEEDDVPVGGEAQHRGAVPFLPAVSSAHSSGCTVDVTGPVPGSGQAGCPTGRVGTMRR